MSTAAFVGLLIGLCNHRFSAFQYALLSAFAVTGRVFISPLAGWVAQTYGWEMYFFSSLAISAPGLILLSLLRPNIERMSGDLAEQRMNLATAN
jgi:PAT family beta-lactamase induction signal transducer AmpG